MEHPHHEPREPGTGPDRSKLTREQENYAAHLIEEGIEQAKSHGGQIDATTARRIAATIHQGTGSYLEHFAATGSLNVDGALEELDGATTLQQVPWRAALWDFLEQIVHPEPDRAPNEYPESHPQIFVQPDTEQGIMQAGVWLPADVSTTELQDTIAAFIDNSAWPEAKPAITASVGFHQLTFWSFTTPLEQITQAAHGVLAFGEPFALLANFVGRPINVATFTTRFKGRYESIEESLANTNDIARKMLLRSADTDIDPDRSTAIDDFERLFRKTYLCLEGRHGFYVFTRLPGDIRRPF